MEEQIENFISYMHDVGFIKSKSETFILKRRYTLVIKQAKEEAEQNSETLAEDNEFFINCTKSILCDFFEERTEDVVSGVLDRWAAKTEQEKQNKKQIASLKTSLMVNALSRFNRNTELLYQKMSFDTWREQLKKSHKEKTDIHLNEEREHRIIAEASLSALQVELKEALERIAKMETKERKRIERKKKKIQQKRREQMTKEMARSLNIEETPLKVDDDDRNQMDLEENPKLSSRDKLEDFLDSNNKLMMRKTFHHDQRGSVNTEMRQQRLKNRLLTHRGSFASSSVYSQARTEFSFHPTINYNSKWKPKYDDHHNHKKMWKRMHAENEKINRKKRLLSEQKKRDEMAACTFAPKLVTKKKELDSNEPLDVKHLSLRLYQYADKFRDKREKMKKKYDSERGEEIRFTPKLETVKANNELDVIRERKNVYDGLYEDYQKREKNKAKLKTLYDLENKRGNSKSEEDLLLLSVKKSSAIKGKHVNFYDTIGGRSSKRGTPISSKSKSNAQTKTFSANLYAEKISSKSEIL